MKKEIKKKKHTDIEELFAFNKENYKYLFLGLALLALGFILMIGGKSENPDVFNEAIFNTQRLTIAPLLLIAGFSIEFWAIMRRRKPSKEK
jgi:hypothetical protein